MRSAILAILLACALPSSIGVTVNAQNANITNGFKVDAVGPDRIEAGEIAVITIGDSTAKKYAFTVIPSNKDFYVDTGGKQAYLGGKSGTYTVVLVGIDGENVAIDTQTTTIGPPGPAPPVPPVPPGPDPPTPPVPPVVEGKRAMLIIRETAESTPAMARLITALRNPPHANYLTTKGHTLSILDDDSVDASGQPSPVLESWRPHYATMKLPVLFVIDPTTKTLIHKQSLGDAVNAAGVIEILKANGG